MQSAGMTRSHPVSPPPPLLSCRCCPSVAPAVTWDDGISPFSYGLVDKILGGLKQRNDCPIPSTYFICVTGELFGSDSSHCGMCVVSGSVVHCVCCMPAQVSLACSAPAAADTIPAAVQALYMAGNEIGKHGMGGTPPPGWLLAADAGQPPVLPGPYSVVEPKDKVHCWPSRLNSLCFCTWYLQPRTR